MQSIFYRKMGVVLLASSALVAPRAAVAVTPPPQFASVDQNGVDLTSGLPFFTIDEGGIGSGPGAVRMRRTWSAGSGWTDNWTGGLFAVTTGGITKIYVQFSGISDVFTQSGSTYTSDQAAGATLVTLPGGNFLYTGRDGTKIEFLGTPFNRLDNPCPGADANSCRVPITLTRSSGLKFTFTYDTALTVFKRLASVSSSGGYAFTASYATNNPGMGSEPVSDWFLRTSIAFNNTVNPPSPAPTITYVTDNHGSVVVTDTGGRTWDLRIDTNNGRIYLVTRPGSQTPNITYHYVGDTLDSVTRDGVTTTYSRVVNGSTATMTLTDELSNQTVAVSDLSKGRLTSFTDALSRTTSYQFDANARLTRVTRPEGNYVQYGYDARGNVQTTTYVAKAGSGLANIVTSASFDLTCSNVVTCNKPNSTTDGKGNVTDYAYDATHGGVTSITQPAPTTGAVRPQTRYSYTQVTAASGDLVYMGTGISACQTLASCAGAADETKTTLGYNSNLLTTTVTRGDGTGALAATTTMTYDPRGNLDTVDGPLVGTADTTKYRYDAADEVIGVTSPDPDGAGPLKMRATRTTYRPDGQISKSELGTVDSQSDPDWALFNTLQTTDITFNNDSRPVTRTLSASGTDYALIQISYDPLGRVDCSAVRMNTAVYGSLPASACTLSTQGSFGPDRITQKVYDAAGETTQNKVAVGTTDAATERTLTYNGNGTLATLKDAENNLATFEYDGFDRLSKTRYPKPTKGAGTSSTTDYEQLLNYDANSNPGSRRLRDTSSIAFTYDNLDRVTLKDLPGAEPDVSYAYDNLGRLTTATQTGNNLTFGYDALSRKTSESGPLGTTSFGYDLANRKTSITYPTTTVLTINYAYLVTGELSTIKQGANPTLATYGYDNLGNRTSVSFNSGASQAFSYDPVSRLSQLTNNLLLTANDLTATFSYNPASQIRSTVRTGDIYAWTGHGNGSTNYVSNGLNEQTKIGGVNSSWDSKGNLTSEPQSGKTYCYSSENLLVSSGGTCSTPTTALGYDPRMRLYQVAGAITTRFLYDGADAIAEYNSSNTLQRRFVFDPTTHQPVLWYEGSGTLPTTIRYLSQDERGSVISVSTYTGALFGSVPNTYDEYGKPGSGNVGRFQYTGQMWISELGAYHYRARVYLPHLGIFAQTDPVGYVSPNLYAYVGNDPLNRNDPTGMDEAAPLPMGTIDDPCPAGYVLIEGFCYPTSDAIANGANPLYAPAPVLTGEEIIGASITSAAYSGTDTDSGTIFFSSTSLTSSSSDLMRSWIVVDNYGTGVVVQSVSSVAVLSNGSIVSNQFYEAWPQVNGTWQYGNTDEFAILDPTRVSTLSVSGEAYYYPGAVLSPGGPLVPGGVPQAGILPSCTCQTNPMMGQPSVGPVTVTFTTSPQ